jgi:hypothetical protein
VNPIVKTSVALHNLRRIRERLFLDVDENFAANHSAFPSLSEGDKGWQGVLRTQV